mmetsp:Transcript_70057/g.198579  ORF Transcript_70057/g.198579 Transcript_70057/m.198579 type:complete len:228 (+) Transcript_70057:1014-1697(+)
MQPDVLEARLEVLGPDLAELAVPRHLLERVHEAHPRELPLHGREDAADVLAAPLGLQQLLEVAVVDEACANSLVVLAERWEGEHWPAVRARLGDPLEARLELLQLLRAQRRGAGQRLQGPVQGQGALAVDVHALEGLLDSRLAPRRQLRQGLGLAAETVGLGDAEAPGVGARREQRVRHRPGNFSRGVLARGTQHLRARPAEHGSRRGRLGTPRGSEGAPRPGARGP